MVLGVSKADGLLLVGVDQSYRADRIYQEEFLPAYLGVSGGEAPTNNFHGYAFEAYNLILDGIEKVAIKAGSSWLIPRRGLKREVIRHTNFRGITREKMNCSKPGAPVGDCNHEPNFSVHETVCTGGTCGFAVVE